MHPALRGVLAPVVTPFDASGDVLDLSAFVANVRAHLTAGCTGVVVTGSSGEAALLDDTERVTLIRAARTVVGRDRWLIAGIGAESTRSTIERAHAAAGAGADAVLVVGPHYYPQSGTPVALRSHYTRIAEASPVPVLLYNIPKYMHYALPPAVVHELARHPNVIGMKDSSGDAALLAAYLECQGDTFTVLTGHGGTVDAAAAAGVRGAILAVSLFAAALTHALWEAARAGRVSEAHTLQARLLPLARDIVGTLGVAGVKAALELVGLAGGPVRAPLQALTTDERAHVARLMRTALAADPVAGAGCH